MEVLSTVVLFSRFSQSSKQFLALLDQLSLEGRTIFKIELLCVDSMKVRNMVLKSGIKSVPYVVIMYTNGQRETFEGDQAFDWITDVLLRLRNGVSKTQPPAEVIEEQEPPKVSVKEDTSTKNLENKLAQMEKMLMESQQRQQQMEEALHEKEPPRPPPKKNIGRTPIGDYPVLSDDEDNQLISEDIEFDERGEKPSALQKKQSVLHNVAAEMQKEREMTEEKLNTKRRGVFT